MKIVTFWGGLGNQIFDYAYYLWLRKRYPNENIYAFYPKAGLSNHNGLEIYKRFDIEEPPTSTCANIIGKILFYIIKPFKHLGLRQPFTCVTERGNYKAIFHCAWWQDKKYYPQTFHLPFKDIHLSEKNVALMKSLVADNSVSVHVRRGDYLKPNVQEYYGGICTQRYYDRAIQLILQKTGNDTKFIFFSDDAEYVRQTYNLPNMVVVDWNKGEDSFIDMYLMSKCKNMILANSTFSYWAAMFNKDKKTVICPTRWNNSPTPPNIIQDDWIKIES